MRATSTGTPTPHFSQVLISRRFKSLVSQVLISRELDRVSLQVTDVEHLNFRTHEMESGSHCIRNEGERRFSGLNRVNFLASIDKAVAPPIPSHKPGVSPDVPREIHRKQAYLYFTASVNQ
jgi:hypothetical protein